MDVRPGYKRTEVEVIPQEWVITSLADCCKKITDGTHDTPRPVKKGVPFVTAIHVKDNRIAYDECLFVSKADHEIIFKRCNPEKGDVLLVNIGAGVATTALVEVDYEFSLKNVALLKPDSARVLGIYLSYCLAKKKEGITQALLSGGAQPFLSLTQIGQIRIPAPPLPEQRAIAEALSDADALIQSLEQLLTKKRQIKKGAMQELLTGKKRLPGFSREWEVKRLEELADCLDHVRVPLNDAQRAKMPGLYPYCGANGILDYVNDFVIDGDVILIAEDGGYFDEYAYRPIAYCMSGKIWVNNHAHILKAKFGYSQAFLYFSLVHKNILQYLASGTRAKLNKSEMNKIEIFISRDHAEQTAIATILSDMDAEIVTLEAKLSKVYQLKQGMMQELLTGGIRLI